jgi:hypothetical protein
MTRTLPFRRLILALQRAHRENLQAVGRPPPVTKAQAGWTRRRFMKTVAFAGATGVASGGLPLSVRALAARSPPWRQAAPGQWAAHLYSSSMASRQGSRGRFHRQVHTHALESESLHARGLYQFQTWPAHQVRRVALDRLREPRRTPGGPLRQSRLCWQAFERRLLRLHEWGSRNRPPSRRLRHPAHHGAVCRLAPRTCAWRGLRSSNWQPQW